MASTTISGAPAVASGRKLKVALLVSLAINLLVVGAVAAALLGARRGVGPLGGPVIGSPHLLGFLRTLPQERRETIWRATSPERSALAPARKEMRRARDDMHRALTGEPFDKERFAAALKTYDDTEASMRRSALGLISAVAGNLDAEERRAYVQWQAMHRRGPRRGGPPRPDAGDDSPADTAPSAPADPAATKSR